MWVGLRMICLTTKLGRYSNCHRQILKMHFPHIISYHWPFFLLLGSNFKHQMKQGSNRKLPNLKYGDDQILKLEVDFQPGLAFETPCYDTLYVAFI